MSKPTPEELSGLLEAMVDAHGLAQVLGTLAQICGDKADHLRTNWGDSVAALAWDKTMKRLDQVAGSAVVKVLSG